MPRIDPDRIHEIIKDLFLLKPVFQRKPPVLSPQGHPYATFHRRMMACMIDAVILMLLMTPFNGWIMQIAYGDLKVDPALLQEAVKQAGSEAEANTIVFRHYMEAGLMESILRLAQIQYTVLAGYSFIFWHRYAATPGKMLLGMRIVDARTDENISDSQSVTRIIGYLLSGLPALLGFFAIGWNRRRQGWHDRLARTAVIVTTKSASRAADPSDSPAPAAEE